MRRVIIASLVVAASLGVPAASATVAGGGWSKPATLLPAGTLAYQPAIAIAPNGTAVVVWDQYDANKNTYALMDAVRSPQGKVTKFMLAPAANAFAKPALAVGGDGTFAVAWELPAGAGLGSLGVKIMASGQKRFGATTKVSGSNLSNDYSGGDSPSIAVDDAGDVFVAYVARFGARFEVVERQKAKGARAWSSAVRFSSGSSDSHGARIAADGSGSVALSWAGSDNSNWAVAKTAAAARFGAAQKIATATYQTIPASVATSDGGKSAVLWEQSGAKGSHRIASKVGHGRFPSKTQYVSGSTVARYPALALGSNGSGAAAWEQEVAGGWEVDAAALSSKGTAWGAAAKLTPTGFAATFGAAPVVAANSQRAVVGWSEKDLHHASYVGASVRVGSHWSSPANFVGLGTPVVAVPNDPSRSPVAGAMIWLSTSGLQISILK